MCNERVLASPLLITTRHICSDSKPKYLSGDKVFVYCLTVLRGSVSVSIRWRHLPHILHFFSPPPPVSWLYWRLKCSRSKSVTLGDKKAGLHPLYALIFQSTGDRARGYSTIEKKIFIWFDNNKKLRPADWIDLKLIPTKAGGELWQFRIDLEVFYSTAQVN